jgi:hypothetical protein
MSTEQVARILLASQDPADVGHTQGRLVAGCTCCMLLLHSGPPAEERAVGVAAPAPEPSPEDKQKILAALRKMRAHVGQAGKAEKACALFGRLLSDPALSHHYRDEVFQARSSPHPHPTCARHACSSCMLSLAGAL